MIMAHESHHQPYIDFSSPSAAGGHSIQAGFEPHPDLFGLSPIPNPNYWRGLNQNPVAGATSPTPWPNQGLSLSLSNPKVSTDAIGFHLSSSEPRGELNSHSHQPQLFMEDYGRFFQSQQPQLPYQVRSSRYLIPAQELLMEFCNLGESSSNSPKNKGVQKGTSSQWEEGGPSNNSLYSMDLAELQKRKAKLVSMLEELFRRYRRYCEQMRSVVSSFEAVAGEGAAAVYSALASRAMSRHFRCLRDGIMGQIKATKKAMGEKDAVAPGTTKGETPRLKMLEQCLRQQKAFQQAGLMESQPWRPQRGLPERSVSVLRAWLFEHFLHPYPSDVDKHILARQTGLSRSQVSNWFINARVRLWKPMVEEMYMEELKDEETSNSNPNHNPSSSQLRGEDQKPAPGQLLNDSDSLASIINSKIHNPNNGQQIPPRANNFGVVDLDFSSYNSVSLTLGLQQQHDRGGMSLSFSPATQHSLLFSRENMDDGRPVQFSILDGEEQNLPYRNLMGAQLLHDLAG